MDPLHALLLLVFGIVLFVLLWWLINSIPTPPAPANGPAFPIGTLKIVLLIVLIVVAIAWLILFWAPKAGLSLSLATPPLSTAALLVPWRPMWLNSQCVRRTPPSWLSAFVGSHSKRHATSN